MEQSKKAALFVILLIYPVHGFNTQDITNLYRDLFNDTSFYRYAPARKPTEVLIRVQLEEIGKIDDVNEMLVTRIRCHIRWKDKRLVWDNDNNYGGQDGDGISAIQVPPYFVWKPDIALINGVTELNILGSDATPVKIIDEGQLQWSPVGIFESKCHFDLEYYPFDVQTCEVKFGTVSSDDDFVEFKSTSCIKIDAVLETSTWTLENIEEYESEFFFNPKEGKKQQILTCAYKLRRKYKFYVISMLLPLMFLGVMNPLAFLIPCDSGEKISFAITLFLSFAVYDTILMEKIPINSDKISYLQLYIAGQLAFTVFILIASIVQTRINTLQPDDADENVVLAEEGVQKTRIKDGCVGKWKKLQWMTRADIILFFCTLLAQVFYNIWFYSVAHTGWLSVLCINKNEEIIVIIIRFTYSVLCHVMFWSWTFINAVLDLFKCTPPIKYVNNVNTCSIGCVIHWHGMAMAIFSAARVFMPFSNVIPVVTLFQRI